MQGPKEICDTEPTTQDFDGEKLAENATIPNQASSDSAQLPKDVDEDYEYITGLKLAVVVVAVTVVVFLMMLDTSIIGTVSRGTNHG